MLQGIQPSRTNGRGLITLAHARRPADRIASLLIMPQRSRCVLACSLVWSWPPDGWMREAVRLMVAGQGVALVAHAGWSHPFPSRTRS
jgi:hypothetical protein